MIYSKEYYEENKDKLKENQKKYNLSKKGRETRKKQLEKTKERRRELQKARDKRYRKKHQEKILKYAVIYRKQNKDKIKARNHANNNKQIGEKCEICGSKRHLHFHHTDYEKNEGITACAVFH